MTLKYYRVDISRPIYGNEYATWAGWAEDERDAQEMALDDDDLNWNGPDEWTNTDSPEADDVEVQDGSYARHYCDNVCANCGYTLEDCPDREEEEEKDLEEDDKTREGCGISGADCPNCRLPYEVIPSFFSPKWSYCKNCGVWFHPPTGYYTTNPDHAQDQWEKDMASDTPTPLPETKHLTEDEIKKKLADAGFPDTPGYRMLVSH